MTHTLKTVLKMGNGTREWVAPGHIVLVYTRHPPDYKYTLAMRLFDHGPNLHPYWGDWLVASEEELAAVIAKFRLQNVVSEVSEVQDVNIYKIQDSRIKLPQPGQVQPRDSIGTNY